MDSVLQSAREHHRLSGDASRAAARHRELRDMAIRRLWRDRRDDYTYAKIATAVGCSPELVAKIITGS